MADYSADPLRQMVKQGKAMPAPGQDRAGRFPIKNREDLLNAIRAVGRVNGGEAERAKVRRFVRKRAAELNLAGLIPSSWAADGSLKTGS
jgi:hypothetical protein